MDESEDKKISRPQGYIRIEEVLSYLQYLKLFAKQALYFGNKQSFLIQHRNILHIFESKTIAFCRPWEIHRRSLNGLVLISDAYFWYDGENSWGDEYKKIFQAERVSRQLFAFMVKWINRFLWRPRAKILFQIDSLQKVIFETFLKIWKEEFIQDFRNVFDLLFFENEPLGIHKSWPIWVNVSSKDWKRKWTFSIPKISVYDNHDYDHTVPETFFFSEKMNRIQSRYLHLSLWILQV